MEMRITTRELALTLGLGALLLAAQPVHASTDAASTCKDTKARTTGKKIASLLNAIGKNIRKSDPVRLSSSVSKAQSKMTKGFVKAESQGGCATTGDVGALEAKTDAFSLHVTEDIAGATCGNGIRGGDEECDAGAPDGAGPSEDCAAGTCNPGCQCATCGDGIVGGNEACDEGAANGTSASCCSTTCTLLAASTPCDDTDGNACTTAGCDGSGGACDEAHVLAPSGAACGDTTDDTCTDPDTCDDAGTCLPHDAPAGAACGDQGVECQNDDACDGAGSCTDNGPAVAGSACGDPSDTACTDPDACDGAGSCLDNHATVGAACGDQGVECQNDDACDGAGSCADNGPAPAGSACGDPSDTACTDADGCDGAGSCFDNHATVGAACGDQGVECQNDDACDGAGGCTDNGTAPDGIACTDTDGEACTVATCNSGTCNQDDSVLPDGTTCGPGAGCNAETCHSGTCTSESACCSGNTGLLSFETGPAIGNCGVLRNFRCSNNTSAACATDADCDEGLCGAVVPFFCGDLSPLIACASNADCVGTCAEVVALNLPLDLECGGLYTGGGDNSVPLPVPIPDMERSFYSVTSCDPGTGELLTGPTAPGDGGGVVTARTCTTGRECSTAGTPCVLESDCPAAETCDTVCLFGPPRPIPNAGMPATSVCTVNDVAEDAAGTTQCDGGEMDLSVPLRFHVFLTGDLFQMSSPPDIPGVQPCPLCDTFCVGGANDEFPCDDDSDCTSGDCATVTACLGGPNDGLPCTPATSDSATLGDTEGAFPTSHDCPPEPSASITGSIGGLPVAFALTSGTIQQNATDLGAGTGAQRVFAGFCRDDFGAGTLCFEGDTDGGCPAAIPAATGNAVACSSDLDCTDGDEYESCAQRTPGAFSEADATQINVFGASDAQCLGDGAIHAATFVGIFDVPPTFDATVDEARDLPGPGAAMLQGSVLLE
jgi:hypothetical protein